MKWKRKWIGTLCVVLLAMSISVFVYGADLETENRIQVVEDSSREKKEATKVLTPVTELKAVTMGKSSVQLSWKAVTGAQEYIIYRQIGKGKMSYLYVTKNVSYLDTTASGTDYNFYRVFPSYMNGNKRITGPSDKYVYAKYTLEAVEHVKAVPAGKNKVKLNWNQVSGAEGYLIYAQKNGEYGYCGMTSNLNYTDSKALDVDYNFYWIFPYYKQDNKVIPGNASRYVYAKGLLPAVTGLQATVSGKMIKLTWNKVKDADGYMIYRKEGQGEFEYLYIKDANSNSYTDSKCSAVDYNYYRVYPYHNKDGKMITGISDKYVYGQILLEPVVEYSVINSDYGQVQIRWKKARGADGYFITRTIGKGEEMLIADVGNGSSVYYDNMPSTTESNVYGIIPYLIDGKNQCVFFDIGSRRATDVQKLTGKIQTDSITGKESYTAAYEVLEILNGERRTAGLQPLVMDQVLLEAAMQRAAELTVLFSHIRPNGLPCFSIDGKVWGENIAVGYKTASSVMKGWMSSPGHKANILKEDYRSVGIGCFNYEGTWYWVQLFGDAMLEKAGKPADRITTRTVKIVTSKSKAVNSTDFGEEIGEAESKKDVQTQKTGSFLNTELIYEMKKNEAKEYISENRMEQ